MSARRETQALRTARAAYMTAEWTARHADRVLAEWGGWRQLHFAPNGCGTPTLMGIAPTGDDAPVPHYAASLRDSLPLLDLAARWRPPVRLCPDARGQWTIEVGAYTLTCTLVEVPRAIVAILLVAIGADASEQ